MRAGWWELEAEAVHNSASHSKWTTLNQWVRRSKERLLIQMLKSFRNYNHELVKDTFIKIFFFFDDIKYEPRNKNLHQRLQKNILSCTDWHMAAWNRRSSSCTCYCGCSVSCKSVDCSEPSWYVRQSEIVVSSVCDKSSFLHQSSKLRRSKTHTFISQFDSSSCHEERNQTSSRPIPLSS